MDGKHWLLPSACAGIALGYYFYKKRNGDIPTESRNLSSLGTKEIDNPSPESHVVTGSREGPREEEKVEKVKTEINQEYFHKFGQPCKFSNTNKQQTDGNDIPSSPLFTDGDEQCGEVFGINRSTDYLDKASSPPKQTRSNPQGTSVKLPQLSPTAMQTVHGMENKFFKGLENLGKLSYEQLHTLNGLFLANELEEDKLSLLHILQEMRRQEYFVPGHYKSKIINIFHTANIQLVPQFLKHLDLFEEVMQKIITEDIEKSSSRYKNDAVLVFSEDDHNKAVDFCKEMDRRLEIPDLRIVPIGEMDGNKTELRSLENIFQNTMYLFILASQQFTKDDVKRYVSETGLIESLQSPEANSRIRVLWLDRDVKKFENRPCELRPQKGIDYFHILENKCTYSVGSVTKMIKNLILKGRKEMGLKSEENSQ